MRKITLILMILAYQNSLIGQVLPQHVEFQELGLSFDIPEGWTGQQNSDYLILGHNTMTGLMILFENNYKRPEELKAAAMQGIEDEGVSLHPSGDFNLQGDNRVEGMYEGYFDGSKAKCYAIGLINGLGSGMNILVISDTKNFSEAHKKEADKLAASVEFFQSRDSDITAQWKQRLVGKQLKYEHVYGNQSVNASYYSERNVKIHLCSNGRFSYYLSGMVSATTENQYPGQESTATADGNSSNELEGNYKIRSDGNTTYLELYADTGEELEYTIDHDRNEPTAILMDGVHFFASSSQVCN